MESSGAGESISGDTAIDTATAAQLEAVKELVRDVSARMTHILIVAGTRIGPEERRQLEGVAEDLRYAIEYLNLGTPGGDKEAD